MTSTMNQPPMRAMERAAAARSRRAARRLLVSRTVLVVAATTLALGSTLLGLGVMLRGDLRGLLLILFFGAPAAWALVKLLPKRRPLPEVETLGPDEHPALQAWIRGVADRLAVPPPAAISLQPSASVFWVRFGEPAVLGVGIGWLGWLRQPEMERTIAARLTWLRCLDDRTVAKAVAFLERVEIESLMKNEAPIVGIGIRRIGRALDTHATALGLCLQEWVDLATPADLAVDESTEVESEIAAIGWDVLIERWVVPMRRVRLNPRSLVDEHFRILTDFGNDLIERQFARREGSTGAPLLDLRTADHAVTARTFADPDSDSADRTPYEVIDWDDYVERVVLPTHRTIAATGIATATRITGAPAPATLGAWVTLTQSGWLPAIGAAMAADPANWGWLAAHVDPLAEQQPMIKRPGEQGAPQPPSPNPHGQVEQVDGPATPQELVAWTITSMFALALTDKGLASLVRSSGRGVALLDESGTPLPLVHEIERIAAAQDTEALSSLALAELDPDEPVWLGDNAEVKPDREILGVLAYRRWLPRDAIFTPEGVEIHRSRKGQFWRDTLARMTGSGKEHGDLTSRLDAVANSRRAPLARVAYADVIDARIVSHGVSMSQWKLSLRTADGTLSFIGMSGGSDVPRLLRSYLGPRLATAGFARERPGWMRWVTYLCWAVLSFGCIIVIAGLYGLVDPNFGSSDIRTRGQVLSQILLPGIVIVAIGYLPHWLMNRRVQRSP